MGQVAGTVAQDRHRLLAERGEDQLTLLARCDRLQRLRVDDLRIEHILPHMGTILVLALTTDTGTTHLRQAININGLDVQLLLQLPTDAPRPRLRTEEADTQLQVLRLHGVTFLDALRQVKRIGWGAAKRRRAKILHQHDLLL